MYYCIMAGRSIIFLCYLLMGYNAVQGHETFSTEGDHKMEKHIKLVNKSSIKTIEADYGELYDCVDFYEQPAFDHPLSKNYTFNYQKKISSTRRNNLIGLKDGGCPDGSVPVMRIKKHDPVITEHVAERLDGSGIHYAVVQSQRTGFISAEGRLSVYSPSTKGQEYSAARIKVQDSINGNEFIAFGWRRDPTRYGDSFSHFYIQTNTDSAKCIDVSCGFVLVAKDVTPGMIFRQITIPGEVTVVQVRLAVIKENDGNWWLEIGEDDNTARVGYWPNYLFKGLSDFATYAEWGGEVYAPYKDSRPSMGTGNQPFTEDVDRFGFISKISIIDTTQVIAYPLITSTLNDIPAYTVLDVKSYNDALEHTVLYGGPGLR